MWVKYRSRRAFPNKTRCGFLLVEIGTSLLLFCAIASTIFLFYWRMVAIRYEARRYLEATTIASNTLEAISVEPAQIQKVAVQQDPFVVTCRMGALDEYNFVPIEVNVSWQSLDGQKRSLVVSSGIIVPQAIDGGGA